jgi:hypothetical protein
MIFTLRDQHPSPMRRAIVLVALVALFATACDFLPEPPGQDDELPPERPRLGPILPVITTVPPPPEPSPQAAPTPTTTTVPGLSAEDLRVRDIATLEGQPPFQFIRDIDDGGTILRGRVTDGSGGPVGGATVRLERVTVLTEQRMQTSTNDDGYWQVRNLSGGRYRIRAWRQPDLAAAEPGAVFVENGGTANVDLSVEQPARFDLRLIDAPALPRFGEEATFTVRVTSGSVDDNGQVANVPLPGVAIGFPSTDRWVNVGSDEGSTDGDGRARWTAECAALGGESVTVTAEPPRSLDPRADRNAPPTSTPPPPAIVRFTLDLPACANALPKTTLKTGDTFTVPYPGAIPAGRYQLTDGPATCGFTYDAWFEVGWLPDRGTHVGSGELQLPWPARDLRRAAGSPADCAYELVG